MSFGQAFYRGSDCCFLVLDVTNKTSFESLDTWKSEFISGANPSDPNNFPFVVLANKVDEESDRVVSLENIKAWCEKNGSIPCYETSAKTGVNVEEAFMFIAEKVVRNMKKEETPMVSVESQVSLSEVKNESSSGCC